MDFFGSQDGSKRQSHLLLIAFIFALLLTGAVIHFASALLVSFVNGSVDISNLSKPALAFVCLMWSTCIAGLFFRYLDVRAGGAALARRFGAVTASEHGRHTGEKELLNVVAEVAIAAGVSAPEVFVLKRQSSINAFVVGGFSGKEALVVSQGALDSLDRDQLQAVVAHEFGHITQGDIPLNMRMLVALGGLNAIDEVGRLLIGSGGERQIHPGTIVGYVMRVLGSVGVYSGRVIRAAFSRQREFLADATGVQFTRNPSAMASTLAVIRNEHDNESSIESVHAEEIVHLCFHTANAIRWFDGLLATHPPIQKRIDAIDPHFDVKSRVTKRTQSVSSGNASSSAGSAYSDNEHTSMSPMSRDVPMGLDNMMSDKLMLMLGDDTACLAVLHACFVSDDPKARTEYFSAISFAYNKLFSNHVKELHNSLEQELKTQQLVIIEYACEQLKNNIKHGNRQRAIKSLEKLLSVEGEYNLMNYATLQLIRRKMDIDFPVLTAMCGTDGKEAEARLSKSFHTMGKEFALLLSLIVEASELDDAKLDEEFNLALKCYTQDNFSRRSGAEAGIVPELEDAFQCLYVQPRAIKEAFVSHCVEIARRDGHLARAEQALLDLFAASLGCDTIAA